MSIRMQAEMELAAGGFSDGETQAFLSILDIFFQHWDSGGAVAAASDVLVRLISGQPLSPLKGTKDEWVEVADGLWQNRRCSSVFSDREKAWDIDAGDPQARIQFPYDPPSKLPRMPVYQITALVPEEGPVDPGGGKL